MSVVLLVIVRAAVGTNAESHFVIGVENAFEQGYCGRSGRVRKESARHGRLQHERSGGVTHHFSGNLLGLVEIPSRSSVCVTPRRHRPVPVA